MRAVTGIYENGVVSLTDWVPLKAGAQVTVFVPEDEEEPMPEALRFAGMLSDLTPEESETFDAAVTRPVRFDRKDLL
jgi:predicted DNA-binding antitoxin AbrB/MazE fold protein